jgi:hypothetical protein
MRGINGFVLNRHADLNSIGTFYWLYAFFPEIGAERAILAITAFVSADCTPSDGQIFPEI